MNNSNIILPISKATVTAVHEFKSFKGYGVDFYIEAQTSNGTVYLQIVTYDDMARSYCQHIHAGDEVQITGALKVKTYQKKDGTAGTALIIERPTAFAKIASGNRMQLPQDTTGNETPKEMNTRTENAVSASAVTADHSADNKDSRLESDNSEASLYENEEINRIVRNKLPPDVTSINIDYSRRVITFMYKGNRNEYFIDYDYINTNIDNDDYYDDSLPF